MTDRTGGSLTQWTWISGDRSTACQVESDCSSGIRVRSRQRSSSHRVSREHGWGRYVNSLLALPINPSSLGNYLESNSCYTSYPPSRYSELAVGGLNTVQAPFIPGAEPRKFWITVEGTGVPYTLVTVARLQRFLHF